MTRRCARRADTRQACALPGEAPTSARADSRGARARGGEAPCGCARAPKRRRDHSGAPRPAGRPRARATRRRGGLRCALAAFQTRATSPGRSIERVVTPELHEIAREVLAQRDDLALEPYAQLLHER